jgi:dihydrolipoamide dehydrogenase
MIYSKEGRRETVEANLAVVTIGWQADTDALNLAACGIEVDARGFVKVNPCLATSVPHVFAAGDVTGLSVLVPPAVLDAHVAATNAVRGTALTRDERPIPMGGFTDPEYAHVGLTEAEAKGRGDAVVGLVRFDEAARTIIDGRTTGFCKLIADRRTKKILGCHVVGERAADIVQAVAMAMAGGLTVEVLAHIPLAFPTYVGILSRAAYRASRQIDPEFVAAAHLAER